MATIKRFRTRKPLANSLPTAFIHNHTTKEFGFMLINYGNNRRYSVVLSEPELELLLKTWNEMKKDYV